MKPLSFLMMSVEDTPFLTAVGLLPIATAGLDIDQMMEGAAAAAEKYNQS